MNKAMFFGVSCLYILKAHHSVVKARRQPGTHGASFRICHQHLKPSEESLNGVMPLLERFVVLTYDRDSGLHRVKEAHPTFISSNFVSAHKMFSFPGGLLLWTTSHFITRYTVRSPWVKKGPSDE